MEGEGVLITDGKDISTAEIEPGSAGYSWGAHGFWGYDWTFYFDPEKVTHWMPLPELPK